MAEPYVSLASGLTNLLTTGKFSDLKILCGDREFKVHKNVICCQSKPLMAMCTNGMKESQESVIDLTVDTEPCVSRLVKFLYNCDYDALEDDNEDASMDRGDTNDDVYSDDETDDHYNLRTSRQLSLHVDMYVLADKYDIISLANFAKKKFGAFAKGLSMFPADTKFPVLETIPRIYAVPGEYNRGLRGVVVEYVRIQRTSLDVGKVWTGITDTKTLFKDKIERLFKTVPEFAVDVSLCWLETPYLGYCGRNGCMQILREEKIGCNLCNGRGSEGPLQWAMTG